MTIGFGLAVIGIWGSAAAFAIFGKEFETAGPEIIVFIAAAIATGSLAAAIQ